MINKIISIILNSLPLIGIFILITGYESISGINSFYAYSHIGASILLVLASTATINSLVLRFTKKKIASGHPSNPDFALVICGLGYAANFLILLIIYFCMSKTTVYGRWSEGTENAISLIEKNQPNSLKKIDSKLEISLKIAREEIKDIHTIDYTSSLKNKVQDIKERQNQSTQ